MYHRLEGAYTLRVVYYTHMRTRSLKSGKVDVKPKNFIIPTSERISVGTISRPRICIIEALIIWISCLAIAAAVRLSKGKQDLVLRMLSHICQSSGVNGSNNPIGINCKDAEQTALK